jgi:hypothetical protein
VRQAAGVRVVAGDYPLWVDAERLCTLAWAYAGARSLETGDGALRRTQKAVIDIARVKVITQNDS